MSEEQQVTVSEGRQGTPVWMIAALVILAIVALGGIVVAHNASTTANLAQQSVDTRVKAIQQDTAAQFAQLQQQVTQSSATNAQLQSDLKVVTRRLRLTQSDLKKADQATEQLKAANEENQQKLADVDTVKSELATKASADDVKAVDTRVTGVRTDLDATSSDLKMARSELGTLIARNHEQIDELRRLGERDYIEFTVDIKNKPQKVGNIMVELRGTNVGKKRYNVRLIVDDVQIDKKNLPQNEPIFFHQGGVRQPLELVVNTIAKDKITGYVSVPKNPAASQAASSASM